MAEGLLTVEDLLLRFFPVATPQMISPNLAAMQVRHLLSMFMGHHFDTTEAIARFGQLYLQKGQWQGQQLIPAN